MQERVLALNNCTCTFTAFSGNKTLIYKFGSFYLQYTMYNVHVQMYIHEDV